jgi:hypothetical protein
MILCFSQDDFKVVSKAYGQQTDTFGTAYCYLKNHSYGGFLGRNENLFITAHGNEDEIGNKGAGFDFTPQKLSEVLKADVLPGSYAGSIYVSACDTSPKYVKNLLAEMGGDYAGRIYGCVGAIELAIKPPGDGMWVKATS